MEYILIAALSGALAFTIWKGLKIPEQNKKIIYFLVAIPLFFAVRESSQNIFGDDYKEATRNDKIRAEVSKSILENEGYQAIKKSDPVFYSSLEEKISSNLIAGKSVDDVRRLVTDEMIGNLSKVINRRSDSAVRRFVFSSADIIKSLQERNDNSCYYFLKQESLTVDDLNKMFSQEIMDNHTRLVSDLYGSEVVISNPTTQEEFEKNFLPVGRKLYERFGEDILLLDQPNVSDEKKPVVCEASKTLYNEILDLPLDQGMPILRYMLTGA